jgi:hypothetical protein
MYRVLSFILLVPLILVGAVWAGVQVAAFGIKYDRGK